jgi:hypothetical protein
MFDAELNTGKRCIVASVVAGIIMLIVGLGVGYASGGSGKKTIETKCASVEQKLAASAIYPDRNDADRAKCEMLVCKNGKVFPTCACTDGLCQPVAYFADPCVKLMAVTPTPSSASKKDSPLPSAAGHK